MLGDILSNLITSHNGFPGVCTFRSGVDRLPDRHRELKLALPSNPIESEQRKAGDEEGQEEEIKRSNTMSVHRSGKS